MGDYSTLFGTATLSKRSSKKSVKGILGMPCFRAFMALERASVITNSLRKEEGELYIDVELKDYSGEIESFLRALKRVSKEAELEYKAPEMRYHTMIRW